MLSSSITPRLQVQPARRAMVDVVTLGGKNKTYLHSSVGTS